jgi:hypothetical protein
MNVFKKASIGALAITSLLVVCSALAQTVSDGYVHVEQVNHSNMPVIYVGNFQTVTPSAATKSGSFARMRAERDAKKIDANAQKLSAAVVKSLQKKGVAAYSLSSMHSIPATGWLVDCTYTQTISHSPFPMISSLVSADKPNTDAAIHIRDLSAAHVGDPVSFTSSATLKGQGTSFSTNPYKLAAHIVIHRIEAYSSMSSLADAIANSILAADKPAPEAIYATASTSP